MKDKRIAMARIVATILVVIGHCVYAYGGGWPFEINEAPFAAWCASYIYTFHMAFFMILSGCTFKIAYSSKVQSVNFVAFIKNRFMRLIVPMLFIKFFIWNPVNVVIGNYSWSSGNMITELGHTWYLAVLFIISVVLMMILKLGELIKAKQNYVIIVVLIVAFAFCLVSEHLPNLGKSSITGLWYYPFYVMVGFLISNKNMINIFSKIWPLFMIFSIGAYVFIYDTDVAENIVVKILFALVGSFAWLGFSVAISKLYDKKISRTLEKNSMAIYLFHLPIIYLILGISEVAVKINAAVVSILLFIISMFISILIGTIFNKFKLGRILIGSKIQQTNTAESS